MPLALRRRLLPTISVDVLQDCLKEKYFRNAVITLCRVNKTNKNRSKNTEGSLLCQVLTVSFQRKLSTGKAPIAQ